MVSRRKFLKSSAALSALASMPLSVRWHIAQAATAAVARARATVETAAPTESCWVTAETAATAAWEERQRQIKDLLEAMR